MQPAYGHRRLCSDGGPVAARRNKVPTLARPTRRAIAAGPASPSKEGGSRQAPGAGAVPTRPSGGRLQRLLRSSSRQAVQPAVAEETKLSATDTQAAPLAVAEVVAGEWEEEQQVAAAALSLQERPQAAAPQDDKADAEKQAEAPAAPRPGGFSLYSWLTWGSSGSAPTSAADAEDDSSTSAAARVAATAELADGMAAAEPPSMPAPSSSGGSSSSSSSSSSRGSYWRRSWSSLSGRAGEDEGEAGAAAARSSSSSSSSSRHRQQHIRLDHPALELLRQRVLSSSQPGDRRDSFKMGLVVEGGGMRGCVSGGALQALTDLGLRHCFDAVYGSSAGAINSTYFLSGQRTGVEIYHDHIASPQFIDLKRLWKGRGSSSGSSSNSSSGSGASNSVGGVGDGEPTPVLNLSFLVDHVMHNVLPLDWEAVINSPVPLKVVASSLDTLNPVLLQSFSDRDDLAECLKASATIPEIAGGPRLHRGQRLVDAAIFEPVPFRSAIADGCTHALVLCTRPVLLTRRSRVNTALADAMEVAIKKAVMSPDYMVPAWKAEVDRLAADGLSEDDMLLQAATQPDTHTLPWFAGAHVLPLYPGAPASFSPLCIDPPTLKAGVVEGRLNVLALCRDLLGDCLDFSGFPELDAGSSNIVTTRSPASSSARLWRRYLADADDFSHHAW